MNSRGNFHNIDFILHIKNSTSCYPFRLKEQNITGKLKAGNKKKNLAHSTMTQLFQWPLKMRHTVSVNYRSINSGLLLQWYHANDYNLL